MYVKHSRKELQGLKKFHVEALNLTFKIHITLNSYSIFEKQPIKKTIFKMLGINPRELTARNSEAH